MPPPRPTLPRRLALRALSMTVAASLLGGCAVITVADTAAGLAVSTVGLAADAAIGTVRLTGKAVGAVADLALPDRASQ